MPRQRQDIWLLVTAHPDDESMFFLPAIRSLLFGGTGGHKEAADENYRRKQGLGAGRETPIVRVLCLSNGDYRGPTDGPIRVQELHDACSLVGLPGGAATVLDDARMRDGPNEVWCPDSVAEAALEHIRGRIVPETCGDLEPPCEPEHDFILTDPDEGSHPWSLAEEMTGQNSKNETLESINLNLLTFDERGVSGHPNHLDTFRGIRHLLNERCQITQQGSEMSARLRLRPGAKNVVSPETDGTVLELNVSAYVLRTISNPLYKYLLWLIAEMIPFLLMQILWTIFHLAHFLSGGIMWSDDQEKVRRIPSFSGMEMSASGTRARCRMADPFLVWGAMAAHRSQFVWYRRLSVVFSRYTYINNLRKVAVTAPPVDDIGDNDSTLPPVVTVSEEEPAPPFLLNAEQMNQMRDAVLPLPLRHRPWRRVYSLSRDGDSFVTFQRALEDWNRAQRDPSSLVVVKTSNGDMIGGFADGSIIPTSKDTGSGARTCLFRLEQQGNRPTAKVYGKSGASASKRVAFSASRRFFAFGGGGGGSDEGFGLCLEDAFARGTTARCAAFDSEPLVADPGGVFEVLDVEVWGFVFGRL